jgi:nucleotide-binding universal stress UspA family protein
MYLLNIQTSVMNTRIVIPINFSDLAKIGTQYAVEFGRQMKANLVLLHVLPSLSPTLGTVSTTHLKKDIITTITKYTEENTGELLVMFTHHVTFLEQLFSKSVAREIAWHNKIPMLVISNR